MYEVKRVRLRLRDGARSVEIRSESNVISVERVDQIIKGVTTMEKYRRNRM